MKEIVNITEIKSILEDFSAQRDWQKFHNPKNISMALAAEAGELLEIFQWLTPEEANTAKESVELTRNTAYELADILLYTIRLADLMDINLTKAIEEKILINEKNYPAELVKGSAKKYTEY